MNSPYDQYPGYDHEAYEGDLSLSVSHLETEHAQLRHERMGAESWLRWHEIELGLASFAPEINQAGLADLDTIDHPAFGVGRRWDFDAFKRVGGVLRAEAKYQALSPEPTSPFDSVDPNLLVLALRDAQENFGEASKIGEAVDANADPRIAAMFGYAQLIDETGGLIEAGLAQKKAADEDAPRSFLSDAVAIADRVEQVAEAEERGESSVSSRDMRLDAALAALKLVLPADVSQERQKELTRLIKSGRIDVSNLRGDEQTVATQLRELRP